MPPKRFVAIVVPMLRDAYADFKNSVVMLSDSPRTPPNTSEDVKISEIP